MKQQKFYDEMTKTLLQNDKNVLIVKRTWIVLVDCTFELGVPVEGATTPVACGHWRWLGGVQVEGGPWEATVGLVMVVVVVVVGGWWERSWWEVNGGSGGDGGGGGGGGGDGGGGGGWWWWKWWWWRWWWLMMVEVVMVEVVLVWGNSGSEGKLMVDYWQLKQMT